MQVIETKTYTSTTYNDLPNCKQANSSTQKHQELLQTAWRNMFCHKTASSTAQPSVLQVLDLLMGDRLLFVKMNWKRKYYNMYIYRLRILNNNNNDEQTRTKRQLLTHLPAVSTMVRAPIPAIIRTPAPVINWSRTSPPIIRTPPPIIDWTIVPIINWAPSSTIIRTWSPTVNRAWRPPIWTIPSPTITTSSGTIKPLIPLTVILQSILNRNNSVQQLAAVITSRMLEPKTIDKRTNKREILPYRSSIAYVETKKRI